MPLRSAKVIVFPPPVTFQEVASPGSAFCVSRFMRTNTPPVRYRTASEESSSTSNGLNVLGSEAMQKRSSDCAMAVRLVKNTHHRNATKVHRLISANSKNAEVEVQFTVGVIANR